jgi:glycosyltransferase 2 family protein
LNARLDSRGQGWKRLIQALCSLALLAWLLMSVHWADLWDAFAHASPLLIAFSGTLYYLGILLSCLKWRLTLHVEQIDLPLSRLVSWYLIGAFASNFMPTNIGGDLGRYFFAGRAVGRPLAVARSIIVERLSGLAMLLALAWLGALLFPVYQPWALLAFGLVCVGGLVLLVLHQFARGNLLLARLWGCLPERLQQALSESLAIGGQYWRRPRVLVPVLLISTIFQAMAGCTLWLNLWAVGVVLPPIPTISVGIIIGAIGLLPITVNGWGLREAAIITLLGPLGAPMAGVLAGALLSRAILLVLSLPGAILLLWEQRGGAHTASDREA